MVTGPLATLNTIWKDYGVSISVSAKTGLEAHNDVMVFISPDGQVDYRATPFADESETGSYSSPAATVSRWGRGIATYAEQADGAVSDPTSSPSGSRGSWIATPPQLGHRRHLAVIVVITVLTDLPVSTSRASDISAERSVMSEVNGDLAPCALALHQAVGIWTLQGAHRLLRGRAGAHAGTARRRPDGVLVRKREHRRSGANIQPPGTAAGKHVGDMLATAMLWTTSDALRAIEDVQTLMSSPKDTTALRSLAKEETQLSADRETAIAQERAADRTLRHASSRSTCRRSPCPRLGLRAPTVDAPGPCDLATGSPRRYEDRRHPRQAAVTPAPLPTHELRTARCRGRPRSSAT